jgi:hypothetical protein
MKTLVKQLKAQENHFGSGTRNSPAFDTFFRSFKSKLSKQLKTEGCSDISFSKGHFHLSGFFKKEDQWMYFSISDVRWGLFDRGSEPKMLYRTATSNKDYVGGMNQYVSVGEDMVKYMRL